MHWLLLLLGLGAMVFAFFTTSPLLMGLALLAALGLFMAWLVLRYNARMGDNHRDMAAMIDADELRRMRELAEARRAEAATAAAEAAPPAPRPAPQPPVHGRAVFTLPDDPPPQ